MARNEEKPKPKAPNWSPLQLNIGYFLIALTVVLFFQAWWSYREIAQIPYSEFERLLGERQIAEVAVTSDQIRGRFASPRDGKELFVTTRVDLDLSRKLDEAGVKYSGVPESTWLGTLLSWVVPVLLFFGLWMFFFRRLAERQGFGGLMNVGKSKAKVYVERDTGVTFDDVAGVDEAKAELQELVSFLKDRDKFGRLGARIPKGVLLVGPPGTGKTLIARAVAGQAGVPFFSISGSEFVEMFVGVGAARVRDLFEQARKAAPCIIFIDELDSLGKARSGGGGFGGHDEKEQTLNQLLAELDGFDPREGIVLLGATNRPEILDPALLRAGRFDRQVVLDRPDRNGREAILKVHINKVRAAKGLDLERVAALTPGFTGADLANVLNEAALLTARSDAQLIDNRALDEAVDRVMAGPQRRTRVMRDEEKLTTAYHEGGHALAAASMRHTDPVTKVTILPRGRALGYTMVMPLEDRYSVTRNELLDQLTYAMGGRVAEEIVFHDPTTGASNDIEKATEIARKMVTEYGMSSDVGPIKLGQSSGEVFMGRDMGHGRDYSDGLAEKVDAEVRKLIEQAHDEAWKVLNDNRDILDKLASELLEKETLDHNQLAEIFKKVKKLPARPQWLSSVDRPVSKKPPVAVPSKVATDKGVVDGGTDSGSGKPKRAPRRKAPGIATA